MGIGRRLLWLTILGLVMQLGLGVAWLVAVLVAVSNLTATRPELQKIFLQVQQQQSLMPLTPSSSEADRFFESMAPIFSQLNWPVIALVSSILSFGFLGFAYARMTGSTDYLGLLPVLALLSGQSPITLAISFADQGVLQASFSHPFEVALLMLQLLSVYAWGAVGSWIYRRNAAARPSVTTR